MTDDALVRDLFWDGERLSLSPSAGGRRLMADGRTLAGTPVRGCFAHVCASAEGEARIPFDQPEVQGARRAALAWWIPLLGDSLVCLSTLSIDSVHFAGAITVARHPDFFGSDPFGRLFAGTTVRTDIFNEVPPPPGPLIERVAGAPWPGGRFSDGIEPSAGLSGLTY